MSTTFGNWVLTKRIAGVNTTVASPLVGSNAIGTVVTCVMNGEDFTFYFNGVAANDTAKIQWIAVDVTSQTWAYTFSYQII